ncbi:MAG: type II toxin-antitoxin system VapC family toxin [Candidatus Acidiferrales bacterium]
MIVDTSALVAILAQEPGFELLDNAITRAPSCRLSAAGFVETSIVVESRGGPDARRFLESLLRRAAIFVEPVTVEQAMLAREAFSDYGKGRHPAGLNFGDCFSYALAKATGEALLFTGDDFRKTDVLPAIP